MTVKFTTFRIVVKDESIVLQRALRPTCVFINL